MRSNLSKNLRRKQFLGLGILAELLGAVQLIMYYQESNETVEFPNVEFSTKIIEEKTPLILTEFNPNELDESQWKALGFTEKQIATILKYKEMIGGKFLSKEQFKKTYFIRDRYAELEPYILLPETNAEARKGGFNHQTFNKKLNIKGRFNPDFLTKEDWVKMGFSERQAEGILKYKNILGGSFRTKEKLQSTFMISSEQFAQMEPYLILPEIATQNFANKNKFEKPKINSFFDPNDLDEQGWQSLGFSEKQAQSILKYKEKVLRGTFKTLEDVEKNYMINPRFEELKSWIKLKPIEIKEGENNVVASSKTTSAEIKTDFSKINLNEITYKQLLEFGFNEKSAASIVGYRKALGGFVNKYQIYEIYGIDKILAEKLISTLDFSSAETKKYSLIDAPESWLKSHPYFKYSADKIVFYRITYPDEKKIWKLIKVNPEQERKMKMYLK